MWVSATRGPFYMGENSDPDYVYALNALNIVALHSPIHIDHPGTPVQAYLAGAFVIRHAAACIAGECNSVIEDVAREPEKYLQFANFSLVLWLGAILFYIGRRVLAISGSLSAAVMLQSVIFLFPVTLTSLGRVNPEPFLIILSLLFVFPLFELAYRQLTQGTEDAADTRPLAIWAGIAFAAGVTSKITFFPLGLLVFLLPSWRDRLRFTGAAAVAGVVFLIPILGRLPLFWTWVTALVTHKGMYGGGDAGVPTIPELMTSALRILSVEMFLPAAILALFVFALFLRKLRKPLLLAALCCTVQLVIVIKHPGGARYLIPAFAVVAFGLALTVVHGGRAVRWATAGMLLFSLYPNWRILSLWVEKQRAVNTAHAQMQRVIAKTGNCQLIGFYLSSDPVSSLLFADEYTKGLHAPLLESVYPNAVRYNTWAGTFHGWAGVDRKTWLLDQLRSGKCVFMQGSIMVESSWPASTGIERNELLNTGIERLFLLSLPGVPLQRQAEPAVALPAAASPGAPAARPATALPVVTSAEPTAPGTITIEAESFASGNAVSDKAIFGAPGLGVLTSPKVPAYAEYKIDIAATDNYEIFARYATEGVRPVSLLLNGKLVNKEFCGNPTGGYYPAAQRWFPGGVFNIPKGKLVLRLESNGPFPHLDKIALVPMRSPK
jgi:hypothetical protein